MLVSISNLANLKLSFEIEAPSLINEYHSIELKALIRRDVRYGSRVQNVCYVVSLLFKEISIYMQETLTPLHSSHPFTSVTHYVLDGSCKNV